MQTYGIPTISQLLQDTKQFGDPKNASKRYTDTTVLIQEFADHHPHSDRATKAIARMNYIHAQYQKAGKISNDDLLYTLSVFVTEPIDWVARYEWREMTDTEKNAFATFCKDSLSSGLFFLSLAFCSYILLLAGTALTVKLYAGKSIGDSMNISYQDLAHHETWIDGLQFYEDIKLWAQEYEVRSMVPAKSNQQIADQLVPLLLFYVPGIFRPFASKIIAAIMGERLRTAMMFPAPHKSYLQIANTIFSVRRFCLRYLTLPRPHAMRVQASPDEADPVTKNYYQNSYLAHPYYNKPGFWNNWGPVAWFKWLSGGDLPGSKGSLFRPEGYRLEEVGPDSMKGKGGDEMRKIEERIRLERPVGCPFKVQIQ